jgi:metal-responsive CopG/Arc/MetJ family transcriptional regulator
MLPTFEVRIMRTRSRTITISLSPSLQARMDARIADRNVTRSEYLRVLIERDFDDETNPQAIESQLGFIELGIDALLKHHPNEELRGVVHNTHRDRLARRTSGGVEA